MTYTSAFSLHSPLVTDFLAKVPISNSVGEGPIEMRLSELILHFARGIPRHVGIQRDHVKGSHSHLLQYSSSHISSNIKMHQCLPSLSRI